MTYNVSSVILGPILSIYQLETIIVLWPDIHAFIAHGQINTARSFTCSCQQVSYHSL